MCIWEYVDRRVLRVYACCVSAHTRARVYALVYVRARIFACAYVHIHTTCLLTLGGINALQRETEVEILNYVKKIKEQKGETWRGKRSDRGSAICFAICIYIYIYIYKYKRTYIYIWRGKRSDRGSAISFA